MTKEEKVAYDKKRYYENQEREIDRVKLYQEKNKEKILAQKKEYRKLNKLKRNLYELNRRKLDNLYDLKCSIRRTIRSTFYEKCLTKNEKTEIILGCSYLEFKLYLESKFLTWMTWDNRGLYNGELNYGWDIDHIIPLSTAITELDIIKLNHYSNLQPLCSYNNRCIKRDK